MGRIRIRVSRPSALDVYELVSIDMHDELYDVMFPFVNHIPRVVVTISNLFAQPVQVAAAAMEKSESRNLAVFSNNLRVYIRRSICILLYGFR